MESQEVLTPKAAADLAGLSPRTLANQRSQARKNPDLCDYIPFYGTGKGTRYLRKDVLAWLKIETDHADDALLKEIKGLRRDVKQVIQTYAKLDNIPELQTQRVDPINQQAKSALFKQVRKPRKKASPSA